MKQRNHNSTLDMKVAQTIPVLMYDDEILVVQKPAGMVSIQDGYAKDRPSLHLILSAEYGRLWVVHRLDADTSGVMVFARTPKAHRHLNRQFELHSVQKTYHLLTLGPINWNTQQVNHPLRMNGDREHRTVISQTGGKPASTSFKVLQRFTSNFNLLEASPYSGYTHQIRAHASYLGLWLLHDPLYAPRIVAENSPPRYQNRTELFNIIKGVPISRTALHAYSIQITHPGNNQPILIEAPYPSDFSSTLSFLHTL